MEPRDVAAEPQVDPALAPTDADDATPGHAAVGRLAAAGLVVFFAWVAYTSYGIGFGSLARPGPGLWPMLVSLACAALSLVLVVRGMVWSGPELGTYRWSATTMVALIGYAVLMPVTGYVVATALLCVVITRVVGGSSWRTTAVTAILTPIGATLIFNQLLGVPAIGPSFFS